MKNLSIFITFLFLVFPSSITFSEITSKVTKIIDGHPREITYYKNTKEIAKEIFAEDGKRTTRSGVIPDGIVFTHYPSGKLRAKTPHLENEANGTQEIFAESGKLISLVPFRKGKTEGIAKDFYPSGKIKTLTPYINGLIEGKVREYYESGKLSSELLYKSDKLTLSKCYNENGQLTAQNSWPDDKEQIQTTFRKDGSISEIAALDRKNGQAIGPIITFFENGRIHRFNELSSKGRVKTYLSFDENGKKETLIHNNFFVWIELLVSLLMICLTIVEIYKRKNHQGRTDAKSSNGHFLKLKNAWRLISILMSLGGIYGLAMAVLAFSRYAFPNSLFSGSFLLLTTGVWLLVTSLKS